MDFKLFDDYITLQSLLKEQGIIQSGGAVKHFLATSTVLVNGEDEKRRGKKLRVGDLVTIPDQGVTITLLAPSSEELTEHQADQAEKERVATLVKKLNKANKEAKQDKAKTNSKPKKKHERDKKKTHKAPVRFPGT